MKLSKPKNRPSYYHVDLEEKYAQVSSRNDTLNKSFVTEVWMRVISRAIDDLALYRFLKEHEGKELKEEEIENEMSAYSFLFDDDHRIPIDDYFVDVKCPQCFHVWRKAMSDVAGFNCICPSCSLLISWKIVEYNVTDDQVVKEISLEELISFWGVENINSFRHSCWERINNIISKKVLAARKANERLEKQKAEKESLVNILKAVRIEKKRYLAQISKANHSDLKPCPVLEDVDKIISALL